MDVGIVQKRELAGGFVQKGHPGAMTPMRSLQEVKLVQSQPAEMICALQ